MIDLDALEAEEKEWSNADDLYCIMGVHLCLGHIPYSLWRAFCYTYCHYRYVLPDDRCLNPALLDTVYAKTPKTAAEMMRFVLLFGQIEAHFTEREQARMLSILVRKSDNTIKKLRKTVIQLHNGGSLEKLFPASLLDKDDLDIPVEEQSNGN